MNRFELHEFISRLLYEHDFVLVPGFGAFVGNFKSSRIDIEKQTIRPPFKEIRFNPSLVENDGFLAHHLSKEKGITYPEAMKIIETTIKYWRETLEEKGSLELPGLGQFKMNEGIPEFIPDFSVNHDPRYFGLQEVALEPIQKEYFIPGFSNEEVTSTRPGRARVKISSRKYNHLVTYSVMAYLPVLAFLWYLFLVKEPFYPQMQTGQISSILDTSNSENIISGTSSVKKEEISQETNVDKERAVGVEKPENKENPDTEFVNNFHKETFKFHIIAGSFQYKENAKEFLNQLQEQGYNAAILTSDKTHYRVSMASFKNRQECIMFFNELKKKGVKNIWILTL